MAGKIVNCKYLGRVKISNRDVTRRGYLFCDGSMTGVGGNFMNKVVLKLSISFDHRLIFYSLIYFDISGFGSCCYVRRSHQAVYTNTKCND